MTTIVVSDRRGKSSVTTPSQRPCSTGFCIAPSCSTSMAIPTVCETTTPDRRSFAKPPPEPANHYSETRSRVMNFAEHNC